MKHHPCEDLLGPMTEMCRFKHYKQHTQLLQTYCKKLPEICHNLSPRRFKKYLDSEEIFMVIFYAYKHDVRLTSVAAEEAMLKLSDQLGNRILRQKVQNLGLPEIEQSLVAVLAGPNLSDPVMKKRAGFGEGADMAYDPFEVTVNRVVTSSVPVSVFDLRKK